MPTAPIWANTARRIFHKRVVSGRNTFSRRYMPWDVVYTEEYDNIDNAVGREKSLKTTTGRRFLRKIFEKVIRK